MTELETGQPSGSTTGSPTAADPTQLLAAVPAEEDSIPCKVCSDKSSGLHYGIMSCEGCKGFFRRSIQKQVDYRCIRNGQCDINRASRNRCQYCRFKKCLAVGMSKDSVRYGRLPRRGKPTGVEKQLAAPASLDPPHGSTPEPPDRILDEELAVYDLILTVSQAHHTNCLTTQDKVRVMRKHTKKLNPGSSSCPDDQRCSMWQAFASHLSPTVRLLVEFSKHIPGFAELKQDDQLVLMKTSFCEMWLVRLACLCGTDYYNQTDSCLTLSDGLQIPRDELETIYTVEFISSVFEFAQGFNSLQLSDTEIGLFTAVVLVSGDRTLLKEPEKVDRIKDRLIEALNLQISRNHQTESALFGTILMKLPDLRRIGNMHHCELEYYRTHYRKLSLPPLVAEIYDIPKNDGASTENGKNNE